jgi:hypothetical protein
MDGPVDDHDPIIGDDGELIGRLLDALRGDEPLDTRRIHNIGVFVAVAIGPHLVNDVVPVSPDEPDYAPGTVGAAQRDELQNVSYDEWLAMFRERLQELTESGIDEGFLIQAIRDLVTRTLTGFADIGPGDENRRDMSEGLLQVIDDPAKLELHRQRVAKSDPSVLDLHIDQYADQLRDFAEKIAQPTQIDDATERWAHLEYWNTRCQSLLNDDAIDQWQHANAIKRIR